MMMNEKMTLEVFPSPEALAGATFNFIQDLADQAQQAGHVFRVAFSGGTTPKRLFSLVEAKAKQGIHILSNAEIFFVDDRWVPEGDKDNNGTMAWNYFKNSNIAKEHFHAIPTNGKTPEEDAGIYQKLLKKFYGKDVLDPKEPLFDLVMLGLGGDGHTASLFPKNAILQEREAWVGTSQPLDAPHRRVTLTYPAIESAKNVVFLVEGKAKAEMLARLLEGDTSIPAGCVKTDGELRVMADIEATSAL
ncbi:6-phosphogluconolactonase [Acetobacteraceae bacterium]|nr:6-phosphogluconolactonase [Acetobacteraceae bacterium]